MVLAGQLPDNPEDAALVLQAVHELVDRFLSNPEDTPAVKAASNVLPFSAA